MKIGITIVDTAIYYSQNIKPILHRLITFSERSLCLLGITLFWFFLGTSSLYAAELKAVSPAIHNSEPPSAIATQKQALIYLNAQNLVNTWNNIIIQAKTGDEQLKLMRQSGVFADDVELTFDFNQPKIVINGLNSPEAKEFYNGFVNKLKKNRYNIATNVEAVEFGKDSLRFNFKHWIFFNDKVSLVGEDQAVIKQIGDRYQITSAIVRPIYFDVANGY
jgi:hypothetical protein